MRIEQTITIDRPASEVFEFLADPSKLAVWQPNTADVLRDREGPLVPGERFREIHTTLGRRLESTVEVARHEAPRLLALRIVDGPLPLDGSWELEPAGSSTRLHFVGEGSLRGPMRFADRLVTRSVAKRFARYHGLLKSALEHGPVENQAGPA